MPFATPMRSEPRSSRCFAPGAMRHHPIVRRVPARATGMFLSPDNRKLLIALLAIPTAIFALVGSNVGANHAPKPQDLPVGVIGTPSTVRAAAVRLERRTPNGYSVHGYRSLADARTAI